MLHTQEVAGSKPASPTISLDYVRSRGPGYTLLFAVTIFLSAFLLFQVQPLIARYILPWFGGSPSVWTTCMLFFQSMLLVGYAYTHLVTTRLPIRGQGAVHLTLLIGALFCLPITPAETWKPTGNEDPTLTILLLLAVHIGIPYLAVSSTAPLLQRWISYGDPAHFPIRLYALSNTGSLLGLLTYPVLVAPLLPLGSQTIGWSLAFAAFALLCGAIAAGLFHTHSPMATPVRTDARPWALWIALPACGSLLLLATTNQICQELVVIPFLWILPLTLYLLSFIITFGHERWYDRRIWTPMFIASVVGSVSLLHIKEAHILLQLAIFSTTLFSACMICHGELVRLKPSTQHLTAFYLMIALGGALGGVFVTLLAPLLFRGYWEFHLSLVATYGLLAVGAFAYGQERSSIRRWMLGAWGLSMAGLLLALGTIVHNDSEETIAARRSFYGVWRVHEFYPGTELWMRVLAHGVTSHGLQMMDPEYRRDGTTYYGPDSGVALAIELHPKRHLSAARDHVAAGLHVGVLGLGAGTVAAYGATGDRFRFYEIDDEVIELAREQFHFLGDSLAEITIVPGDGRISLAHELHRTGTRQFDVFVLDAFTGGAVPAHLLTREAFDVYWRHLNPGGILAVNITNKHLNLEPVIRTLAEDGGKEAIRTSNGENPHGAVSAADWILVTSNQAFLESDGVREFVSEWETKELTRTSWRDDYTNLLGLLR